MFVRDRAKKWKDKAPVRWLRLLKLYILCQRWTHRVLREPLEGHSLSVVDNHACWERIHSLAFRVPDRLPPTYLGEALGSDRPKSDSCPCLPFSKVRCRWYFHSPTTWTDLVPPVLRDIRQPFACSTYRVYRPPRFVDCRPKHCGNRYW